MSQPLLSEYETRGIIRVPHVWSAADVQQVRQELDRYRRDVVPHLPARDVVLEADGQAIRNLWRMEEHDAFFDALRNRADILALVAPLVHGVPVSMGAETFNKPAKLGSGVPPHQDNAYFCQRPPDMLTVWIALDAVTEENGPITYLPGSHQLGLLPHRPSGVQGNSMGLAGPAPDIAPYAPLLEPGDAAIHHCETIHFSSPNRSSRARCGLLLVYRGEHTITDPSLQAVYDHARELVAPK